MSIRNRRAPRLAPRPPASHQRVVVPPRIEAPALQLACQTAPLIPSPLLRKPRIAAQVGQARAALARQTGKAEQEIELTVRTVPGSDHRLLVFQEAGGHQHPVTLPSPTLREGVAEWLADLHVLAGSGPGYRIVPGVLASHAMWKLVRTPEGQGLQQYGTVGASSSLGGAGYVWRLDGGPRAVGAGGELSVPFVSAGANPLLGDTLELSIPGFVSLLAAVKRQPEAKDVGWLGVVWHQGLGPHAADGATVDFELVLGHPALARPLAPAVDGALRLMNPLTSRLHALLPSREPEST